MSVMKKMWSLLIVVAVVGTLFTVSGFAAEKFGFKIVEGKFGGALNCPPGTDQDPVVVVPVTDVFVAEELTVELWMRMDKAWTNHVVLAYSKKDDVHWEMFITPTGQLAYYTPAADPVWDASTITIADGNWHYVTMAISPTRLVITLDGTIVHDVPMTDARVLGLGTRELAIGSEPHTNLAVHDGLFRLEGDIDEIRILNKFYIPESVPTAPFEVDANTIGLWHLDEFTSDGLLLDETANGNHARIVEFDPMVLW